MFAAAANAQVVISQVNGNGGLGTAVDPFDRDFVELFNRGTTTVDMTGWSIQIFADNGNVTTPANPTWDVIPISGVIRPGQYFLIAPSFQRGSLGSNVTTSPLPAPDAMGPVYDGAILVSGANAVALMSNTTPIAAGNCPSGPNLVDLFRVGLSNSLCFEGSGPGGPPSSGTSTQGSAFRNDGGCDDTNDSAADITTQQLPEPRNSDTNVFVTTLASPNVLETGTGGLVTLTAVSGSSPCNPLGGALTAATANLSAFGLSASEALFDDGAHGDGGNGDGTFGIQFNVPPSQGVGAYVIPMTGTSGATTLAASARVRVFPTPATNDTCATAIDLTSGGIDIFNNGPHSTLVNTLNATGDGIDAGTCNGDAEIKFSVWYSFTASASGAVRVVENSTEDIVTSVYTSCGGASVNCLNREDVGMPVLAGNTYYLQIGREINNSNAPQAPLDLTFSFIAPPANDTPCAATPMASFPFSDQPYGPALTDETSPAVSVSCDAAANTNARNGAWYSFTAPDDGALEFFESSINQTNFTVFSGDCSSPVAVLCVDESLSGVRVSGLVSGTPYLLLVSFDSATQTSSQAYNFTATFLPSPDNDTCAGAVDLNAVGLPYSEVVMNSRAATGDAGVPTTTGGTGVNTCTATLGTRPNGVWYTYTTSTGANGTLRVADFSSNDVFYNVFTGSCLEGLVVNQCYGAFTADDIHIQLSPDTTYYILVGMQSTTGSATNDYDLTFTLHPRPANDEPCGATEVTTSFVDVVVGPSATADVDLSCNYNIPAQSTTGFGVWYHLNLPTAQQLRVHQNNSDVLVYGLFTGPDCGNLTEFECRQGSNGALTTDNTAYFNLMPGTDYWLLIGKISNSQPFGAYSLDFQLTDAKGSCCVGSSCSIATAATCGGAFGGPFTYCGGTPNYEETPGAAIPDGNAGGMTRTIEVTDAGTATVADLKVLIDINHARVGDLIITLTGPEGTVVELTRRLDDDDDNTCPNFGSQGRLTDLAGAYIFDDQSYNPYGPDFKAAAKYFDSSNLFLLPGRYKPATCDGGFPNINTVFNGTAINGTWTLFISDNQNSSTGVLNRWGLIINYGLDNPCNCPVDGDADGNGQLNGLDIDPFVECLIAGGSCDCADVTSDGNVTLDDVAPFVNALTQ